MKHYYIFDKTYRKGFAEVTEEEYDAFRQHRFEVNAYAEQVRSGEITLADIPETHRADVETKLSPSVKEKAQAYDILMGVSE